MIKERELACKPRRHDHGRVNVVGVKFGEAVASKGDSEGDLEREQSGDGCGWREGARLRNRSRT